MKICHLSQTDSNAGAGRAAYRIHKSLLQLGLDSRMLVSDKRTNDPTVIGLRRGGLSLARSCEWLEAFKGRRLGANPKVLFSPASFAQFDVAYHPEVLAAEIVSLYWVNGGFVSPESLASINKPLVWRLSDIWPFSGGCHYPGDCERYVFNCGHCPQLKLASEYDASRRLLKRKLDAWHNLNLTVVAPSSWMANLARQSHLFCDRRIEIVPTGVDLSVFKPQNKITVRDQLNISRDRLVIAFGALDLYGDARKGFAKLNSALEHVACSNLAPRCLALIFGRQQLPKERLPITAHFLGHLDSDSALADAYAAADIVVVPSLEDNLPNVALEAIACGVPVVGFNVGGMPEIIRSGWNGALALNKDAESLSAAICEVLNKPERLNEMSKNAVQHARKHFSLIQQGQRFYDLYADLHAAQKTSIS